MVILFAEDIDSRRRPVNDFRMFEDDALPKRKSDLLADLAREDLDKLSVAELDDRIAALHGELLRTEKKRADAAAFKSAADALFKK